MSRVSRYRVVGRFDSAGGVQTATVEVDRDAGIVSVRPLRRRRVYALPLATVAELVCGLIIRAELREKRAQKAARRKRRAKTGS